MQIEALYMQINFLHLTCCILEIKSGFDGIQMYVSSLYLSFWFTLFLLWIMNRDLYCTYPNRMALRRQYVCVFYFNNYMEYISILVYYKCIFHHKFALNLSSLLLDLCRHKFRVEWALSRGVRNLGNC